MNEQVEYDQETFFQLASEIEELRDRLKLKQQLLESVLNKLGINTYHQDSVTGLVYKVYIPEGTFISFKKIDYKRTAKMGEKGGIVLSKIEAQEAGFVLSK